MLFHSTTEVTEIIEQSVNQELERSLSATDILADVTSEAQAFNDTGSKIRTSVWIRLWSESDPISNPTFQILVAPIIKPGEVKALSFSSGGLAAVYQQWFWKEEGPGWLSSQRFRPDAIFGQRTYWKGVALFWFKSSGAADSVRIGGEVRKLPA